MSRVHLHTATIENTRSAVHLTYYFKQVHLLPATIEDTQSAIHPAYYFEQGPLTSCNRREHAVSCPFSILLRAGSTYKLQPSRTRGQLSIQHTTSSRVHLHPTTVKNTQSAVHLAYYFKQGPLTCCNRREHAVSCPFSIPLQAGSTYLLQPSRTRGQLSIQHTTLSRVHLHAATVENTRSAVHLAYYFEQGPLTRCNRREHAVSPSSIVLRAGSTYSLQPSRTRGQFI